MALLRQWLRIGWAGCVIFLLPSLLSFAEDNWRRYKLIIKINPLPSSGDSRVDEIIKKCFKGKISVYVSGYYKDGDGKDAAKKTFPVDNPFSPGGPYVVSDLVQGSYVVVASPAEPSGTPVPSRPAYAMFHPPGYMPFLSQDMEVTFDIVPAYSYLPGKGVAAIEDSNENGRLDTFERDVARRLAGKRAHENADQRAVIQVCGTIVDEFGNEVPNGKIASETKCAHQEVETDESDGEPPKTDGLLDCWDRMGAEPKSYCLGHWMYSDGILYEDQGETFKFGLPAIQCNTFGRGSRAISQSLTSQASVASRESEGAGFPPFVPAPGTTAQQVEAVGASEPWAPQTLSPSLTLRLIPPVALPGQQVQVILSASNLTSDEPTSLPASFAELTLPDSLTGQVQAPLAIDLINTTIEPDAIEPVGSASFTVPPEAQPGWHDVTLTLGDLKASSRLLVRRVRSAQP